MSAVWVAVDEAVRGSLPCRCARTGHPCLTRYRRRASTLPAWVEWLTWTGLWPRAMPDVEVVLPLLPRWRQLFVGLRVMRDASAVAVPVGLVVGLAGGGTALLRAALLVHLVVAVVGMLLVPSVRLDDTGRWVRVGGIHPELTTTTAARTTRPETEPLLPEQARARRPEHGGAGDVVGS